MLTRRCFHGMPGSLLLGVLLLQSLTPSSLGAQGVLRDAVMEVMLPGDPGPVAIRLAYRFRTADPADSVGRVPLSLLTPTPVRVQGRELDREAGAQPFPELRELRPHLFTGQVPFAPQVILQYRVLHAWSDDHRLTLPIPAPGWVPEDPTPRTFVARIHVPAGWSVLESFPTSVTRRPRDDGGGIYEVALQGVPSMLVLRMARGPAPLLTLERVLDLMVVGCLLIMGLWGLVHLRGAGE